ncbi:hypothetical protein F4803DRAFT_572522 [Xylaria telfairii]|nr:hypothetical protein F4803DRAFT_572522 [Xylaria telfairii]
MTPISQLETHPPPKIKGARSHNSEISDLIFSFDDLDMETDALCMNCQKPCDDNSSRSPSPFSSASQTGYVMVPYPNRYSKGRPTFTDTTSSEAPSKGGRVRTRDKQRRITPPLSKASSLDHVDHIGTPTSSSSLYLNTPRKSADSHAPEPTTPRTRQFKENMLSMLSLLPQGRYLSPSPSIFSEGQSEDSGIAEFEADDTCATSPGSPLVPIPSVDCSPENHSLQFSPPSCLLSGVLVDQGEFEEHDAI